MTGVGVTDGPQLFVIASQKSCARTHTGSSLANAEIQFEAQLHHRVGLVDLFVDKFLLTNFLESAPRCIDDPLVLFPAPGYIKQSENHPATVNAQEMVEIATHSALHHAGNVGSGKRRKFFTSGIPRGGGRALLKKKFHIEMALAIITEIPLNASSSHVFIGKLTDFRRSATAPHRPR